MERLTRVLTKTVVYTKGKYDDTTSAEMTTEDVRTVLKKLAEYEDIGTPTELKQLKENGGFTGLELAEIAAALKELQAYRERGLMDASDEEARKSEDEEARKSEEILRKYCESHQTCEGCVFYKEWSGCGLTV
jgi:hypothetical protein|nr:MAG TPA: hypothetical protein [Caudoviricetes sp.]